MPNYYAVKPIHWCDGEEYTCFAESAEEAVAKFLDDNSYDAEYDGFLVVVCI